MALLKDSFTQASARTRRFRSVARRDLRVAHLIALVGSPCLVGTACAHGSRSIARNLENDSRIVASTDPSIIEQGRYLAYGPAHCVVCHTPEGPATSFGPGDEPPLVGGYTIRFTGGSVVTPNLTPDTETGIGRRTDMELVRVLRHGVRADGSTALPIMELQELSDDDLRALISYLRSRPAVRHDVPDRHLNVIGTLGMAMFIRPHGPDSIPLRRSPAQAPTIERGEYLVRISGCASCHTKRSGPTVSYSGPRLAGGWTMELEGDADHVVVTPNLTPDERTGILADWDERHFTQHFRKGPLISGTHMPWRAYATMCDEDLRAIFRYLRSLPPVDNETRPVMRQGRRSGAPAMNDRIESPVRRAILAGCLYLFGAGTLVPFAITLLVSEAVHESLLRNITLGALFVVAPAFGGAAFGGAAARLAGFPERRRRAVLAGTSLGPITIGIALALFASESLIGEGPRALPVHIVFTFLFVPSVLVVVVVYALAVASALVGRARAMVPALRTGIAAGTGFLVADVDWLMTRLARRSTTPGGIMRSVLAVVAFSFGLSGCGRTTQPVNMDALVQSLELDPPLDLDVDCPPLPARSQQVMFAAVFVNFPPIRPGEAGFPSEFCPPGTGFFARAEGHGNSSVLGEFLWAERYCTVPPGRLVAEGYFEGEHGNRLNWEALVRPDSVPPPVPFATFSGEFRFTGGTGAYEGVSGEGTMAARQLGDAAPGRPAGSTAAAVCGWITN